MNSSVCLESYLNIKVNIETDIISLFKSQFKIILFLSKLLKVPDAIT